MRRYVTIIIDRDTSRILVEDVDGNLFIPRLLCQQVPSRGDKMSEWFRMELHDYITTWFDLVFLYSTINETDHRHIPPMYVAMFESVKPVTINPDYEDFKWYDVRNVGPERFPHGYDALILPYALRIHEECSENGVRPWEKPGWLQTTTEVATETLRSLGYEVRSAFQQFRVTPNSSLLIVQTDKGVVYLKASNEREGAITECVSGIDSEVVRKPLHVDRQREWMLMEDYGLSLGDGMSRVDFENVNKLLGTLQRKAESHIQGFMDAGVPRVDPNDIVVKAEKMLEDVFLSDDFDNVSESEEEAEKIERFDENTIRKHCRCIRTLLSHLYENQKIPLTITHGDMCGDNIIKYGTENDFYVIIDWARASIDLPLISVDCLPSHIKSETEKKEATVDSYLRHWSEYGSLEELKKLSECLSLKECIVQYLESYEYAVDKGVRPYFEAYLLSRLCQLLRDIAKTAGSLE